MSDARKVMLIVDAPAPAAAASGLADALRKLGAEVQTLPLAPPYDAVLDGLADGWLPVYVGDSGAVAAASVP